jgi:hypothetical protein
LGDGYDEDKVEKELEPTRVALVLSVGQGLQPWRTQERLRVA